MGNKNIIEVRCLQCDWTDKVSMDRRDLINRAALSGQIMIKVCDHHADTGTVDAGGNRKIMGHHQFEIANDIGRIGELRKIALGNFMFVED